VTRCGDLGKQLIDNQLHAPYTDAVNSPTQPDPAHRATALLTLETLPRRQSATVGAIEWARLASPEARRLRELGFDEGVAIEVLHRSRLGAGPIACRIGRMTVALRRAVARAISVAPDVLPAE
jgi:ferrous iron transport protein A